MKITRERAVSLYRTMYQYASENLDKILDDTIPIYDKFCTEDKAKTPNLFHQMLRYSDGFNAFKKALLRHMVLDNIITVQELTELNMNYQCPLCWYSNMPELTGCISCPINLYPHKEEDTGRCSYRTGLIGILITDAIRDKRTVYLMDTLRLLLLETAYLPEREVDDAEWEDEENE